MLHIGANDVGELVVEEETRPKTTTIERETLFAQKDKEKDEEDVVVVADAAAASVDVVEEIAQNVELTSNQIRLSRVSFARRLLLTVANDKCPLCSFNNGDTLKQ